MNRLSKAELKRIVDLATQADAFRTEIEQKLADFRADNYRLIEKLDEVRAEFYGVMEDLANEAEAYYDERSDRWQASDTGDAYNSWMSRLEEVRDKADMEITFADFSLDPDADVTEFDFIAEGLDPDFAEPE